ncbi:MAG: 4Fe-4S dicluster domain-containing protein [candidate division WOR-3 bacterium]
MSRSEKLRQRAKELLASKEVAMVIGYCAGSKPGLSQPAFITRPEETQGLIFDSTCSQNLANYLLKVKNLGKVAVVAKGCDSRSIVVLLQENQIQRENLYILGVGCDGVVQNGAKSVSCLACQYPNPVIYDEMIGDEVEKPAPDPIVAKNDKEFEQLSSAERWQVLSEDISRCIRCYACRQVCPNCYCPVCFVDASMPQLVGKTHNLSDNMVFHIIRALHMAGRCVECGACHRACPMGIDLMRLNRRVARIVKERFDSVAGVDINKPPALTQFNPADPQEFIK